MGLEQGVGIMTYEEWASKSQIYQGTEPDQIARMAWEAAIDSAVELLTRGPVVSYWVAASKGQLAGYGQYEILANSDEAAQVIAKLRGLSSYNVSNAPSPTLHQHGRI